MLAAIAAALRNAASAIATGFRYCWWAIDWTLGLPGRVLGGGPAGTVPHPTYQPPAGDPAAEIADMVAKRGRVRALKGALPSDLDPSPDGTDPVSATAFAYARATPANRRQVSLEALSPDQVSWLLRLRPHDLDRLAAASGLVCGRLARGMGGGALGVEPCRRREPELSEAELAGREEPSVAASFAERVRRRQGAAGPRLVMG